MGIDLLQVDLKGCLGRLQRAENLRKREERAGTSLHKDPLRFLKGPSTKRRDLSFITEFKRLKRTDGWIMFAVI